MKVLIVDTDWHFSRQAAAYLEGRADLVIQQPDAQEASALAADWEPDLVILSAELADSGILESLRQQDAPPAVLLTENMHRFDRAWRAWQHGGDELFLKPMLSTKDLAAAIVTARQNSVAGTRSNHTRMARSA